MQGGNASHGETHFPVGFSIAGFGQGRGLAVHSRHPAGHGLYPYAVMGSAHVGHIHKAAPCGQAGHGLAVEHRGFHLAKASGDLTEHEHDFGDALIGRKAQGRGGRGQRVVPAGAETVGQGAVVPGVVDAVHDLIGAGEIVGAGDYLIQPDGGGQGVAPVERLEHDVAGVADPGEHIADRLAAGGLLGAGLFDGNAGGQALIGDFQLDDLAAVLHHGGIGFRGRAVVGRGLCLPDGVAAQGEGLGGREAVGPGYNGVHLVPVALVVNLKGGPLQQRTGGQAIGGVVVRGLLHNLDLSPDGGVRPGNGGTAAVLNVNRFGLGVQNIAVRTFNLPDGVLTVREALVDIHIALVVALIGAHGVALGVGEQERHAVDALAGETVHLTYCGPALSIS